MPWQKWLLARGVADAYLAALIFYKWLWRDRNTHAFAEAASVSSKPPIVVPWRNNVTRHLPFARWRDWLT